MALLIATTLPRTSGFVIKKVNFIEIQDYDFISGEFIVKFTKDTTIKSPSIVILNEKHQVSFIEKIFKRAENTILDNIYLLKVQEDSDILSIVKDYSSNPNVEYAEPNGVIYPGIIPNDEFFDYQWSLHNTGQNFTPLPNPIVNGTPNCDIDAPEAWDIETGDQDVVIAIIDSGVDYTHLDLAEKIWVNEDEIPDNDFDDDDNGYIDDVRGWDFHYNDSDPMDGHGHGTICAGVPGMVSNNNIGGVGICWDCQIMPVKIASETWYSLWVDIANGIKYAADNAADIISMSFGTYQVPNILKDAVDYAYNKGVFLCACAHNHNTSDKCYPAAYENVTAVAATNQHDQRCYWGPNSGSNYGEWVDVAAPGNLIFTTCLDPEFNYYKLISGTSLSTPMVAGLAALILSKNPSYSNEKVKSIIRANVDPYDSDVYIGTGRINAYKAITEFNVSPYKPKKPSGKTPGRPGLEYNYTTSTIDPDGNQVSYLWDWGDGNFSDWLGPFNSGESCVASYIWKEKGKYNVRTMAKDVNGGESDWSDPLTVSITTSRNKPLYLNVFSWLFERFPNQFPILRYLLGFQ